jgi:hypothetical protein
VHTADVAEFSAGVATLGIVHSPGYVAYLLLARLALLVPHADAARLLNLLSGLTGAGTVAGLALLIGRLSGSRLAGASAALFFAFTNYQWTEAILATPYTFNTLWLVADLWLISCWRERRGIRPLAAFAFLYGLQPGLHMSCVLQAPNFALQMFGTDLRWFRSARRLLALAALFALALSVWLYLPLRAIADPPVQFARDAGLDLTKPRDFYLYVSAEPFQRLIFGYRPEQVPEQLAGALEWLWRNYLGFGVLVGLLGWLAQLRRDRLLATSLGLGYLMHFVFYANYAVINKDTMFLPSYLLWAIWLGEGLAWLLARAPLDRRVALAAGVLLLPAMPLVAGFGRIDASQSRIARDLSEAALRVAAPNSLILGYWLEITPVQYLSIVEGLRPDVGSLNLSIWFFRRRHELSGLDLAPDELDHRIFLEIEELVRQRLRQGRVVYLFQELQATPRGWRYVQDGPLLRAELGP